MSRVLGVDLGEKRIGIALSDPTRTIASPHSVIKRSGNADVDRRSVLSIAREEGATQLVVGLPLTLTGARRAAARAALAEVEALKELAPDLIIEAFDERLTTAIAQRSLLEGDVRRKDRKQIIDKVAAAVMLQSWLDGQI